MEGSRWGTTGTVTGTGAGTGAAISGPSNLNPKSRDRRAKINVNMASKPLEAKLEIARNHRL
jgi:hypothetical protein